MVTCPIRLSNPRAVKNLRARHLNKCRQWFFLVSNFGIQHRGSYFCISAQFQPSNYDICIAYFTTFALLIFPQTTFWLAKYRFSYPSVHPLPRQAKSAKGRILRHWGNVLGTSSGRFLHHIWPLVTIFLQIDSGLWIFLQAPFCWQIVCFVTHRPHSSTVFFVSLIGNTTEQETNCPIIGWQNMLHVACMENLRQTLNTYKVNRNSVFVL